MIQQLSSVDQYMYCCLFHKKHQVTTEFVRRLMVAQQRLPRLACRRGGYT
jgi:hypothetical protein